MTRMEEFGPDGKRELVRMYRVLEAETDELGNYVSFHEKNKNVFSIKIFNLLFLSCNVFEYALKIYSDIPEEPRTTMQDWVKDNSPALKRLRSLARFEHTILPMNFKINPFSSFKEDLEQNRSPEWWRAYNCVKHDLSKMGDASLLNMLNAMCAAGTLVTEVANTLDGGMSTRPSALFSGVGPFYMQEY